MKKLLFTLFMSLLFIAPLSVQANNFERPVIEDVKISNTNLNSGDKVNVEVKVSDATKPINTIRVTFFSPNKKDKIFIEMTYKNTDEANKLYKLTSDVIPSTYELGKYSATMIQIRDVDGSFTNYTAGTNKNLDFEKITFSLANSAKSVAATATTTTFKESTLKNTLKINGELTFDYKYVVDAKTIRDKNIYVTDAKGKNVPLTFIIEPAANGKSSKLTILPADTYAPGTYNLYIKDISDKNGKKYKQYTKTQFTVVK